MRILIDNGHGENTTGKRSPDGKFREYSYAREIAKSIEPSSRGEIEITSVNAEYMERKRLKVERLGRGLAWFDTGTHADLLEAADFVRTVENRQGMQVSCPEEIAYRKGWVNRERLLEISKPYLKTNYGKYLKNLAEGKLI